MPECHPFCGWLYNPEKVRFEEVFAPPYDIVSEEEIRYFKQKSPYNIFHLELPESPEKAQLILQNFIHQKILVKNSLPTLYYYEIEFPFEEKIHLRRGYILLTRLYPFEEGIILPHEKVYSKITEDRLNLFKATHCQFSQIFSLYEDPNLETFKDLPENLNFYFEVTFNQEIHRLAKIQDLNFIQKVLNYLSDKKFFIADGHHRYTTALKFKSLKEKQCHNSTNKYHYISMYICPFEEKGLLMLPTHRVYNEKYYSPLISNLETYCDLIKEIPLSQWYLEKKQYDQTFSNFFLFKKEKIKIFSFKEAFLKSERDADFLELPLFHFLRIIEEVLKIKEKDLKEAGEVEFFGSEKEAIDKAKKSGFAILFPRSPTKLLKKIALKGKTMPHKATFFYPKILTGAVIYKMD
ncbi:MAG: DUF1015 family protein [Caldimicrobium sp.]